MLAADHENPFDDHYCYGCPQLQQLLLFFYDISKTIIVFWTNVLLILCAQLPSPYQAKPLKSLYTENPKDLIEKILLLQKRKPLKIENSLSRLSSSIQDILVDTLDFVLGTRSRYRQRDYGHREEAAGSMPFTKLRTKDRSSLRRLNTAILDEEVSPQLICQNCGHKVICPQFWQINCGDTSSSSIYRYQ